MMVKMATAQSSEALGTGCTPAVSESERLGDQTRLGLTVERKTISAASPTDDATGRLLHEAMPLRVTRGSLIEGVCIR
jgi:hypothetical protein